MELRQRRYFVAVAEELHFGRAAARLRISSPTLSQQIKLIEREIGAPLLVRHARGVSLTPAGEVLLRSARQVVEAASHAVAATRQAAGVGSAGLRLGLLNGVPPSLPARLQELLGGPAVLVGGSTSEQVALLERGAVDLALLRSPVVGLGADFSQREVWSEELGVLMGAEHPLAALPSVAAGDLSGRELIWFPRALAPGFHDATLLRLRELGGDVLVSDSTAGAGQWRSMLLLHPDAISLSSQRAVAPGLTWRPLSGLRMVYAVAWRAGNRNAELSALLRLVRRDLTLVS